MKIATVLSTLLLSTLPFTTMAANPHAQLPPDLQKAVADFDRAQLHSDAAELQRLLADDYVLFNSQGKVENKADFLRDYAQMQLEPFTVEDETVRYWGDGAVLAGVATLKGVSEGQPFSARLRFSDIWRKRDGRWQVVFTQATRAAP